MRIPQINLNFVDLPQDFLRIAVNIRPDRFKILPVLYLVQHQVFLYVRNLNVDFRQSYFHMNPDGYDCD